MPPFYDAQARRYEWTRRFFLWGRRRIIAELKLKPGERVLEIGCGTGWNLGFLSEGVGPQGRVIGLEISPGMLTEAGRKGLPPNVELVLGDAAQGIPTGQPVDAVLFSYSYSAIPNRHAAIRNAVSALSPTGRIGIVDFCVNEVFPSVINAPFLRWGKSFSCDFSADPRIVFRRQEFDVSYFKQFFGWSYRFVAWRKIL